MMMSFSLAGVPIGTSAPGRPMSRISAARRPAMWAPSWRPAWISWAVCGGLPAVWPASSGASAGVAAKLYTRMRFMLVAVVCRSMWNGSIGRRCYRPSPSVSLCSLVHGRPSYEVGIVDPETGVDQPVSVPGEILVRGYIVTPG
jgi:hypothetical protein